jgi:hypothetical protein
MIVLSLLVAVALGACGTAAATAAPGATTAATEAATQATATQAPGASVDVGGSASALAKLSSYKVTMQIVGSNTGSVETVVVNGATPAKEVTETTGSTVVRIVEIGQDVWIDQGTGTFVKSTLPKSAVDAMLQPFDLAVMLGTMQRQPDFGLLQNMGTEQKNGQSATHLHADQNTPLPAGASPIPAGTVFDIWIATDGGYLVAIEATGVSSTLTSLQIELTNVNDPTLKVEPPA